MISIQNLSGDEWLVTVRSATTTEHRVRVTAADLARFAPNHTTEQLLTASFQFLLNREPNTAILRSFDIAIISRYFPEYPGEITRQLRST
jgi:hypothetical protein